MAKQVVAEVVEPEDDGQITRSTQAPPRDKQMAFDDMVDAQAEEAYEERQTEQTSIVSFQTQAQLTAEDIVIPRLRLAQGLTKEVQDGSARPGNFLLSGAAPREEIFATVNAIQKFRRYATNDEGGKVLCRSEDSFLGIGDPGGECEVCPLSKWVNSETGGKNQPPKCEFGYRYLLDVDDYGQCVYEMKRTAIPAAKALNASVIRFGYGKTRVQIKAQKGQSARGTFYTPVIVPLTS